jgi:glc operon protein GlcG
MKRSLSFLAAAVVLTAAALGQEPSQKTALSLEDAKRVIAGAVAEAQRNHAGGAIAVVDDGGNVIAVERLDGTFPAAASVSIGKAKTAALFQKPTSALEKSINEGRTALAEVKVPDFTPLQGGVPILINGQVVGAVGVSGAASQQQDEQVATAGAMALQGRAAAAR